MRQYLIAVELGGATKREWFSPSESLRVDESDADAAVLAAQEWNDNAICTLVRDQHGKAVTRNR